MSTKHNFYAHSIWRNTGSTTVLMQSFSRKEIHELSVPQAHFVCSFQYLSESNDLQKRRIYLSIVFLGLVSNGKWFSKVRSVAVPARPDIPLQSYSYVCNSCFITTPLRTISLLSCSRPRRSWHSVLQSGLSSLHNFGTVPRILAAVLSPSQPVPAFICSLIATLAFLA